MEWIGLLALPPTLAAVWIAWRTLEEAKAQRKLSEENLETAQEALKLYDPRLEVDWWIDDDDTPFIRVTNHSLITRYVSKVIIDNTREERFGPYGKGLDERAARWQEACNRYVGQEEIDRNLNKRRELVYGVSHNFAVKWDPFFEFDVKALRIQDHPTNVAVMPESRLKALLVEAEKRRPSEQPAQSLDTQ